SDSGSMNVPRGAARQLHPRAPDVLSRPLVRLISDMLAVGCTALPWLVPIRKKIGSRCLVPWKGPSWLPADNNQSIAQIERIQGSVEQLLQLCQHAGRREHRTEMLVDFAFAVT